MAVRQMVPTRAVKLVTLQLEGWRRVFSNNWAKYSTAFRLSFTLKTKAC